MLLGEAFIKISADTKAATAGLGKMQGVVSGVIRVFQMLVTVIIAANVAFFGLATAIGVASVKAFTTFEKAMAKVQSVVQTSTSMLNELGKMAMNMGESFAFGASDAADSLYYLGSAGYNAQQIMNTFPATMALTAATGSDLKMTTEALVNTINAFSLRTTESMRVADVFAATIRSSQATMEKLATSMGYVAPIARILGISLEDSATAMGVLYNRGIQASIAGTGLRMSLTRLASVTTDLARNTLKKLGLSVDDVNPKFNSLVDIIDKLNKSGAGLAEISNIVGVRAATVLLNLMIAGRKEFENMRRKVGETGQAVKQASITLDTMSASFRKLWIAIKNTAIIIGEKLAPYVRGVTDMVTELIGKVRAWVEEGGIDKLLDDIYNKLKEIASYAMGVISDFIGPFEKITKALVFVDVLLMHIIKSILNLRKYLKPILMVLGAITGALVGGFLGGPAGAGIGAMFGAKFAESLSEGIEKGWHKDAIGWIFDGFNEDLDTALSHVDNIFDAIRSGVEATKSAIDGLGKTIKKNMEDTFLSPKDAAETFAMIHQGTAKVAKEMAKIPPWMQPKIPTKGRGMITTPEGGKVSWEEGTLLGKARFGRQLTPEGRLGFGKAAQGKMGESAERYAKELDNEAFNLKSRSEQTMLAVGENLNILLTAGQITHTAFENMKKATLLTYNRYLQVAREKETEAKMIRQSIDYYKKFVPLGFLQLKGLEKQQELLKIIGTPAQQAQHGMIMERARASIGAITSRQERLRAAQTFGSDKARVQRIKFLEERRAKIEATLARQTRAGTILPGTQQMLAGVTKELDSLLPKKGEEEKLAKDNNKTFKNQLEALTDIYTLLDSRLNMGLE